MADPCDAPPDVPLVLLPVRLETRYTADAKHLRIRIFPDDIHVDMLHRALGADERRAGLAYWQAVWADAGGEADADAWQRLLAAVHRDRAAWVAATMTPTNLSQRGGSTAPTFPTTPRGRRRAAVARLLPDRFVALARQGATSSSAIGKPIPRDLVVGLLDNDDVPPSVAHGTVTPRGTEWLLDYAKSEGVGMAITLALTGTGTIDQLLVFGVRSSSEPAAAQAELEEMITAHRFGRGLSFLPQGTPTNNTEDERSARRSGEPPQPPAHVHPVVPAGTNAAVLADALGIDPAPLAGIDHADDRDQPLAKAANTALWGPTWGGFLERINRVGEAGASVDDTVRETIRTFFQEHVRARGPLPALRVGDQPYGILPVSRLETAERFAGARGNLIEGDLLALLREIRRKWRAAARRLPNVGGGPVGVAAPGIDETLLDILGSSPIMQGLRVRNVVSYSLIDQFAPGLGLGTAQAEKDLEAIILGDVRIDPLLLGELGSLGTSQPIGLPLVSADDPAYIRALLQGDPPDAKSVLQALLALSWTNARRHGDMASPAESVATVLDQAGDVLVSHRPQIERLLAQRAPDPKQLHELASAIAATTGEVGEGFMSEQLTPAHVGTSLARAALDTRDSTMKRQLAAAAIQAKVRASGRAAEIRQAMVALAATGLDERRIVLAETLDLASHRLDAWLTGVAERRRSAQRAAQPDGLTIGAYGWVERLAPGAGNAPDGGFVHAPSLDHAATAALLRSAYLSHNPDGDGDGAFAIDLSSRRVRVAITIIDGIRQGQSLGALLGYRIERALHEASLDRLTLSLRAIAPLVAGLSDAEDEVPAQAQEAIAAANVLDGVRLIALLENGGSQEFWKFLDKKPANNPYLAEGSWPKLNAQERERLRSIVAEAADAGDAVADLMLAESVHQFGTGTAARAAAALDAAAAGEVPPVEPQVVQSPAQGVPFTHRVLLLATAAGAAWNDARPRAQAEPRLERWAAARLGSPAQIIVHVAADGTRTTLQATGWAALDFVYGASDPNLLERLVRLAVDTIPREQPLAQASAPDWPQNLCALGEAVEFASSLRTLLVNCRPASPADLSRPGDAPAWAIGPDALGHLRTRVVQARDGLRAECEALGALLAGAPRPENLIRALAALTARGIAPPMVDGEDVRALAKLALGEGRRRLRLADRELKAVGFDGANATAAGEALFGEGFWMLPTMTAPPGGGTNPLTSANDLFSPALGPGAAIAPPPQAALRRFVSDAASVRPAVARHAETLLFAEAFGRPPTLRAAQLTGRPGPQAWIGGGLASTEPTPDEPMTNLLIDGPADLLGSPLAGLVVDGWVDVVPRRERLAIGTEQERVAERSVTGLAVNASAASAQPPQAILLAIPGPSRSRWTVDSVAETLTETLDLIKLRPVTLGHTGGAARVLPAIYAQSSSLKGEPAVNLEAAAKHFANTAFATYVKEPGS